MDLGQFCPEVGFDGGTGYTVDGERLTHGLRWHNCHLNCSVSLI